jgi:transglutaminase-like putative cysteine protease
MKKTIVIGLMFLSFSLNAQNYKLGKVTVDELKEKVHPLDSTACAAILYKKANVYFKTDPEGYWTVVTQVEVKIKIYKKEAYSYANFEKSYYSGTFSDKLFFSDVATYNLVNGKVEKTKMKNDGEFLEQKSKNFKSKKITLPNVKEGSIIEYKYETYSYSTSAFDDFYFQYEIPANYVEYAVRTPEYFVYNRTLTGYLKPFQQDITYNDTSGNYNENGTIYSLGEIKAMHDEDYVNNIDNYRAKITYELSSKKSNIGVVENFATDWESVTKKIYDNEDFGKQLDKNNYFEEDLATITKGLITNEEKINTIFNFVKNRMSWNEYNGYNCDQGVKAAYNTKVGNVAEINLILIAMLRNAGVDASPIILSTRSNGIKIFPSRTAFNYVIAGVELENKIVLLDATDKNTVPNILPRRALNWIGRIIRNTGSSAQIELEPKIVSKEAITIVAEITNEGKVSGKVKHLYFDYNAFSYRDRYIGLTNESNVERMEKKYNGIEISELNIQNATDPTKPILEDFSFANDNLTEIIGDKIYFSPMLFFVMDENPFKQEIREYPVDFIYPNQDKYIINIKIPDGFAIETMPKSGFFVMENKEASFKYSSSSTGQNIQILIVFDINQSIISSDNYQSLKNFFKEVINKETEKIVLKKV